jgi:hypothetical protein
MMNSLVRPKTKSGRRGAGSSALAKFRMERRKVIRREWRDWTKLILATVVMAALIVWLDGLPQLAAAVVLGFTLAILFVSWTVGGNASSLTWVWGSVGEQQTAAVLGQLDDEWWCEHDVPNRRGNWDHIVVGPAGVFLLDSKRYLSQPAVVSTDELRSGRIRTRGAAFRGAAVELKQTIERLGVPRPYVQAVVVIWGEFPQREWHEEQVAYVHGPKLLEWLRERPARLDSKRLSALRDAVRELASLN